MLEDPRAEALATRFASQWLRLQDLERCMPDPIQFPYADQTLSVAFKRETELLRSRASSARIAAFSSC